MALPGPADDGLRVGSLLDNIVYKTRLSSVPNWINRRAAARVGDLARQFPAVLVTGARQTGKTTLLHHLFPDAASVSLDLPSVAAQAESSPDDFFRAIEGPVAVIDEVQYAPALFRHMKVRIDRQRHAMGRFLMTGSQKFALMEAVSESLAGRCGILELDTLSAVEIHDAFGARTAAADLIWRGGFPELWRSPDARPQDFFAAYVATYLDRDVRLALRAGSLRDFERFLRACAARSGGLLNLAELARDIGVAATTARGWLSILEKSNQVVLLEPFFANLGKRLIKTPKLYFSDTGLLCFLLGLDTPATLARSPALGAAWETFVLGQILRERTARGTAGAVFGYRDAAGLEVDFAIEHEGRVRLVEAKWAETPDARAADSIRKVHALLGKRAADEHWIACRTPRPYRLPGTPPIRAVDGLTFGGWFG